jgi:hypothetical protein
MKLARTDAVPFCVLVVVLLATVVVPHAQVVVEAAKGFDVSLQDCGAR